MTAPHPDVLYEMARARQAELVRQAELARLARELSAASRAPRARLRPACVRLACLLRALADRFDPDVARA